MTLASPLTLPAIAAVLIGGTYLIGARLEEALARGRSEGVVLTLTGLAHKMFVGALGVPLMQAALHLLFRGREAARRIPQVSPKK
ncbi:hypothetical protein LMG27177_07415 [Paraburkholderia fynbosensis]|uniref:Uncharacterized protein n=1 Tax=Paraburkholderia fynbosensis TaxID=1200993 RepID=A0A6J5H4A4_9BURK|nr:hypothetical protein LMG27177_07415 [Paraburkholderia fynbosensis]